MKIALSFIVMCVFSFNGCKPSSEKKVAIDRNQLSLNICDDPASLDPRQVRMLRDLTLAKQLFEGLTRLDSQGIPQPALAESIEISEDGRTYTFTLKPSVWTDGKLVTAHDFVHAWTEVLDPAFRCDYSTLFYGIKNAKLAREGKCSLDAVGLCALDDRTLVVYLEKPQAYFLELLAFPTFFPISHFVSLHNPGWSAEKNDRFVCNGPFKLKSWVSNQEIILERNPLYWDHEHVHLNQLHFSILKDVTTESYLFDQGSLDWLGQPLSLNLTPELLSRFREEKTLSSYPIAGTCWYKFNTRKSPFDLEKVRKAFSYAINRRDIIEHLLQGNQQVATSPLPPSLTLQEKPFFQDGDLERARGLFQEVLEEQGWDRETFPLVVLNFDPSERSSKIAQLVQRKWVEAFGIPIQLEAIETHVFRRLSKEGQYQVGMGQWIADFHDPIAFLELFKSYYEDGSGINDTGWKDDHYAQLLDLADEESDLVKRKELLAQAEQLLMEAMPIAPLYHYAFDYVKKEDVEGVLLSQLGIADFKYVKRLSTPDLVMRP